MGRRERAGKCCGCGGCSGWRCSDPDAARASAAALHCTAPAGCRWNTYARRLLLLQLCWFLLWLVSFNVFTIAFQDEDLSLSLRQLLRSTRGRVTVAAELLALVRRWCAS